MAYRGALALVAAGSIAACSLTSLDGYTGGAPDAATPSAAADGATDARPAANAADAARSDPYGEAVRADTPSAWWRFEDGAGSQTLHDEMGAHDGKAVAKQGNPIAIAFHVPGAVGNAAAFGPDAGYFDVADVFDFAGVSEFALEAWGKNETPNYDYEGVFGKRLDDDNGARSGWLLFLTRGGMHVDFQFWDEGNVVSSTSMGPLPRGFHHIVVSGAKVGNGIELTAYLDGTPEDGPTTSHAQPNTSAALALGFDWTGTLDELAIYEHPLTRDRVRAHYAAAQP